METEVTFSVPETVKKAFVTITYSSNNNYK